MEFDGWKNKLGTYTAPQRRQTELASFKNFNRYDNSNMGLDQLAAINSANQVAGKSIIELEDKLKNRPKGLPLTETKDKAPPLPGRGFIGKTVKPALGALGKGIGMLGGLFGRRK
jgi:hypothetical protein